MSKGLSWLAVFIVTFIICVIGSIPVFATSLIAQEVITYPLTILVMGLLAALTASWMSNLLSGDSKHSRILHIFFTTEVIAVLLILLRGIFYVVRFGPNILLLAIWGFVLSAGAYIAAWCFRSSTYNNKRDIIMSLILFALAPIVVVVTIAIASFFGLTGA